MDLGSSQTSWSYKVRFWVRKSLAFAARERLVLGRIEVAERFNELVAIPKLLDLLATEGAIVGTDAIGCQRDIGSYTMRVYSSLESVGGTLPVRPPSGVAVFCVVV
jgi:hypothetical protein